VYKNWIPRSWVYWNSLEYSVASCANEVRKTKRNWILKLSLKNNFYIFSINIESWDLSRINKTCVFSLPLVPISYYSVNHISGRAIHSPERHVTCETGHLRRYHQYNNWYSRLGQLTYVIHSISEFWTCKVMECRIQQMWHLYIITEHAHAE